MRQDYLISPGIYDEGILFDLAREKSAVRPSSSSNKGVENQNWHSALLSFDYVPDLSNFIRRPPG